MHEAHIYQCRTVLTFVFFLFRILKFYKPAGIGFFYRSLLHLERETLNRSWSGVICLIQYNFYFVKTLARCDRRHTRRVTVIPIERRENNSSDLYSASIGAKYTQSVLITTFKSLPMPMKSLGRTLYMYAINFFNTSPALTCYIYIRYPISQSTAAPPTSSWNLALRLSPPH